MTPNEVSRVVGLGLVIADLRVQLENLSEQNAALNEEVASLREQLAPTDG